MNTFHKIRMCLRSASLVLVVIVVFASALGVGVAQNASQKTPMKRAPSNKISLKMTKLSIQDGRGQTLTLHLTLSTDRHDADSLSIVLFALKKHMLHGKLIATGTVIRKINAPLKSEVVNFSTVIPERLRQGDYAVAVYLASTMGQNAKLRFHVSSDGSVKPYGVVNAETVHTPVIDTFVVDDTIPFGSRTHGKTGTPVPTPTPTPVQPVPTHMKEQNHDTDQGIALFQNVKSQTPQFTVQVWIDDSLDNLSPDLIVTLYSRSGSSPNYTYTAMKTLYGYSLSSNNTTGETDLPGSSSTITFYPTVDLQAGSTNLVANGYAIGVVRDFPGDTEHFANFNVR